MIFFRKYEIKFKSFFKKGLPKVDDRFGVYMVCGRQGSGKNYYAVMFLKQFANQANKIYSNVHSLKIEHIPFTKLDEILDNTDEHCIFLIDEVSKKYHRNSPTDMKFYSWLQQSRKRKRIVIMLTQEWRETPMWLRRPVKYTCSTTKTKLLNIFGIYTTIIGDAENMIFNKDEGDYETPLVFYKIYKRNKKVADLYDTFEPINDL